MGAILLERPGLGAAGYTLLLALFLVASGVARGLRPESRGAGPRVDGPERGHLVPARGDDLADLPEAALWVIGTFLGIELVFNGVTWVMLGLAVRNLPPGPVADTQWPAGRFP